jgi:hypothetical protein
MKVALLNANPAVARLATLSLEKIGYKYTQAENLSELGGDKFDVLVIDSDVDIAEADVKSVAKKILFLASKNSSVPEVADKILSKPFLPTEFISAMESLAEEGKENDSADASSEEISDAAISETEIEPDQAFEDSIDDIFEDIKLDEDEKLDAQDELEEIKEEVAEETAYDLGVVKDLDDEEEKPEELVKDDTMDELSELMHEIDEMKFDDELEDSQNDEDGITKIALADEMEDIDEMDDLEELVKEIDEPTQDIQTVETNENDEGKKIEENIDEIDVSYDTENELKIDEEQNLDEDVATVIDIAASKQDAWDENSPQEEVGEEERAVEIPETDSSDNLDITEEVTLQDAEEKKFETEEVNSDTDDIESLNERDLKVALDEELGEDEAELAEDVTKESEIELETVEENEEREAQIENIKEQISSKIMQKITSALSDGELKEALKNLNIKINISFEEK